MSAHPVAAYMRGVEDGSVPAGAFIRQAVARQRGDLEQAGERGFRFDRAAAQHAIDFFGFLKHSKGEWAGTEFVPSPWQQFVLWCLYGWKRSDGLRRFRRAYVEVPRKNGKALDVDTAVVTTTGWKRHGDLQLGDLVFAPNGAPVRVLAATEPYAGPCYSVVFSDKAVIYAHGEHEWLTERTWYTKRRRGPNNGELPPVTTRELRETIAGGARGDLVHSIPVARALDLPEAELVIDPYALGAWLGDGTATCARLTCCEDEILAELERRGYAPEQKSVDSLYLIGRGFMQRTLREMGLLGDKRIPGSYLRASQRQRMDLLRGLMDTDGYVSSAGQCEIVQVKADLFGDIVELLRTLGYKPTVTVDRAQLDGRDCGPRYRVQFWPTAEDAPATLTRKLQRLRHSSARRTRSETRQVVNVEPAGDRLVNCIQVEGGVYLAGEAMVPTHNSTLAAGVGLYMMVADGEPGAEVYSAGTKRDQAKISWSEAVRMVKASPGLSKMIRHYRASDNLSIEATASKFMPLGADADTMDGLNVHCAIIDELHAHRTRMVVDVLDTATSARRQPLIFEITTAGSDQSSICYEHHDYSAKLLANSIEDDSWFAFIACLDEGDDWADPATWAKANPNLGISVKADDLAPKADRARRLPVEQNVFRRLHLDQWTQQSERWIDLRLWDENAGEVDIDKLAGRVGYGGLDLSSVSDLTAWALAFPRDDDPEAVDILVRFWCPEDKLSDSTNKYADQYRTWAQSGHLMTTPGNAVDYGFVKKCILEDAQRFRIGSVNVDRLFQGYQLSAELADEGLSIFGMGQGFLSMAAPMKEFERRLLAKKLHHGGNPVLRFMADNVAVRMDPAGNLKPDKAASQGKIDGIVALVMALDRAMRHEGPKKSVYEERGLVVA